MRSALYPPPIIRALVAISSITLIGCVTDSVTRAEHAEIVSSLRALRAENARIESRLEKLESQQQLQTARNTKSKTTITQSAPATSGPENSFDALPPLTVVKMKPRREAPPKVATIVEVQEPTAYSAEDLQAPATAIDDGGDHADVQFEHGLKMMNTGNSAGGIELMLQFVTDWPRHPKADNALYFSGLAYMADSEFLKAAQAFERVGRDYPAGDALLDSILKLADCKVKLSQPKEARRLWERVVAQYPGTSAAATAQVRLGNPSTSSAP